MAFTYTGDRVELGGGRGWMNRDAAESIFRIDRRIGHLLQITEAGRTWAEQNVHYQHYLRYGSPIALNPDTPSLHQKGNAADTNEGQRIHSNMEDHGFRRTVYRYIGGKWTLVEPWHYEYFPQYDNHRSTGGGTGAGDDMSVEDIFNAKDGDGRNMLDLGRQIRADIAVITERLEKAVKAVPSGVLAEPVAVAGRPELAGKQTSLRSMLAWNDEHVLAIIDAAGKGGTGAVDVEALASKLRTSLAPDIVKALGEKLAG